MLEFLYLDIGLVLNFIRFQDFTGHRRDMIGYLQEPNQNNIQYEG